MFRTILGMNGLTCALRDDRISTGLQREATAIKVLDRIFPHTHLLTAVTWLARVFLPLMVGVDGASRAVPSVTGHFSNYSWKKNCILTMSNLYPVTYNNIAPDWQGNLRAYFNVLLQTFAYKNCCGPINFLMFQYIFHDD